MKSMRFIFCLIPLVFCFYSLKSQSTPKDYSYAEQYFLSALTNIKEFIQPTLSKSQKSLFKKVALKIEGNFEGGAYIGSDLKTREIAINRSFVYWLYNRTLAQCFDSLGLFERKGFLDLFDKLYVYLDTRIPSYSYAKIDTNKIKIKSFVDTSQFFKNCFYLNLMFIYTHELGHFMRQTYKNFNDDKNELSAKMLSVSSTDTGFEASLARMKSCFEYYAFEQVLEVEADAFALEKTLATSFVKSVGKGLESLNLVFNAASSILEAYKYAKSGFHLDIPISTCNLLIRNQVMLYTKDSIMITQAFRNDQNLQSLYLSDAAKRMDDSIRSVATIIFDLCEYPNGLYEERLKQIEEDSSSKFMSWEFYTAFMQNYLAQTTNHSEKYKLVLSSISKILKYSEKQDNSSFDSTFTSGLKEYLYLTLAAITEFLLEDATLAQKYYQEGQKFSIVISSAFYRQAIH